MINSSSSFALFSFHVAFLEKLHYCVAYGFFAGCMPLRFDIGTAEETGLAVPCANVFVR